jgi:hypothetical protein
MKRGIRHLAAIISTVLYVFIYWIVIYIGLDRLCFELSSNGFEIGNTKFSSAKVVYDLFLICIVVSLLMAQLIAALNWYLSRTRNKLFTVFNLLHIPLLVLYLYIINNTESVIPFIKNWHVALLG